MKSRAEFIRWIKDQPCADCGNRFPSECMDFDHLPSRGKDDTVGRMRNYSPERLQAEIMKCQVVCSNCHRTRTKRRKNGQ